jgi:cytochrome b561
MNKGYWKSFSSPFIDTTMKAIKFTPLHRILHWTMAGGMALLFLTGFLRMVWMSKKAVVGAVQQHLPEVEKEQAVLIYKSLRESMWEWHHVAAKVVIFSFLIRIVYMLLKGIRFPNPFAKDVTIKDRLQGLTYVYFYLYVFIAIFTGVSMEKGFFESYQETFESVHKLGLYLFPVFVVLHFVGIVLGELSSKKGIVSKMISGDN